MHPPISNILANIPDTRHGEVFEAIISTPAVRIERIVSHGQITPEGEWYDQEREEWVLLVSGEARILFEESGEIALMAGDYLHIPARCRHRVTMTAPDRETVWLAIHYPPAGSP
jgi:cupin 2 domain-containing protein